MTLPKGFGSGGSGGASSADVEKMIGRRVENMTGIITLSYIAAWLATFGGTAAGYFYYPWAYPTPSGHYAFIILDRKSTRLNSSHSQQSRMPSSA